jgi:DDE superfamily endonuclease
VEELLAERGIDVDHVTVYRRVHRFAPEFAEAATARRHIVGDRWHVDETYLKVGGTWRYLLRAIDQFGQVIDVYLSPRRASQAGHSIGWWIRPCTTGWVSLGEGSYHPTETTCLIGGSGGQAEHATPYDIDLCGSSNGRPRIRAPISSSPRSGTSRAPRMDSRPWLSLEGYSSSLARKTVCTGRSSSPIPLVPQSQPH